MSASAATPLPRKFIPAWFYAFMKRLTATHYAQNRAAGDLSFIVGRCRYMDDLLSDSLDKGLKTAGDSGRRL